MVTNNQMVVFVRGGQVVTFCPWGRDQVPSRPPPRICCGLATCSLCLCNDASMLVMICAWRMPDGHSLVVRVCCMPCLLRALSGSETPVVEGA